MMFSAFGIRAFATALALVFVAGCGVPNAGTMPQGTTQTRTLKASGSSGDLIYVAAWGGHQVYLFSYPSGSLAGTLTGFTSTRALCSDTNGNVWITDFKSASSSSISEYAHDGTSPIATLADSGGIPYDCAWDSSTGNLAVGNSNQTVAVYSGASGSPAYYSYKDLHVRGSFFLSYDGSGNLYFSDVKERAGWLPKGGSSTKRFYVFHNGGIAWDGTYLTAQDAPSRKILQYSPADGKAGKPVGSVSISGVPSASYYSIENGLLAIADTQNANVRVYSYPQGGSPNLTIRHLRNVRGIALSVAPSR